jgi:hypothetical protein
MKSTLDTEQAGSNDLDAVLAEALERGVIRAVEILSGREMLSAGDSAKFIGVSREALPTTSPQYLADPIHNKSPGDRFALHRSRSDLPSVHR